MVVIWFLGKEGLRKESRLRRGGSSCKESRGEGFRATKAEVPQNMQIYSGNEEENGERKKQYRLRAGFHVSYVIPMFSISFHQLEEKAVK